MELIVTTDDRSGISRVGLLHLAWRKQFISFAWVLTRPVGSISLQVWIKWFIGTRNVHEITSLGTEQTEPAHKYSALWRVWLWPYLCRKILNFAELEVEWFAFLCSLSLLWSLPNDTSSTQYRRDVSADWYRINFHQRNYASVIIRVLTSKLFRKFLKITVSGTERPPKVHPVYVLGNQFFFSRKQKCFPKISDCRIQCLS